MILRITIAMLSLLFASACAHGEARKIDNFHWDGVDRVVAISDLHGDYGQYIKVMQSAGLVNSRGKWIGGKTHLVQTGDVPDRGPDTRKILKHLAGLKKQADKKGGKVHTLIGNHEAMNSYGDLRYVHPGEFADFVGANSSLYREKQWEIQIESIKQAKPEEFLFLDLELYRANWEKQVPLGWVEHRIAWQPQGEYGQWVLGNQIAVMVNDTIFLHGGLSPEFCHYSLSELTALGREQLLNYDREVKGVLNDENGPLWYRGLAREDEAYFSPAVEQILDRYGASRIVVGHTPTGGIVWPRFAARVVVNDTGIAAHYGGNIGWYEQSQGKAWAGYEDHKLELPLSDEGRIAYLREVAGFKPDNESIQQRLAEMTQPPIIIEPAAEAPSIDAGEDAVDLAAETIEAIPVREPISPGICLSGSS